MKWKKWLAGMLAVTLVATSGTSVNVVMAQAAQAEEASDDDADAAESQSGIGDAGQDSSDMSGTATDAEQSDGSVSDDGQSNSDTDSGSVGSEQQDADAASDTEIAGSADDADAGDVSADSNEISDDESSDAGTSDSEAESITVTEEADVLYGYTSFAYSPTYTALVFSSSGDNISASTILSKAESIIISNEGGYSTVTADDNGALSIGKLQWHGTRALNLLKTIVSYSNSTAYSKLGSALYEEIVSATDWSSRTLSSSEKSKIQALLATSYSETAQDALADSDVSGYLNRGYNQGIRNAAALVYYADIENQYGSGGSTVCGNYAYRVAGEDWDKVTLNELHIAAICYIYYKYSSDSTRYSSAYIPRRRTTYGTVSGYGWTYCNSGDYRIPYGSVWSTNVGTKWLQTALNTYQNAGLTVDGSYGSSTKAAVKTFQTSVGLTADGEAGVQTVSMLIYKLYYDTAVNGSSSSGSSSSGSSSSSSSSSGSTTTDIVKNSSTGKWEYTVNGVADYTYTGVAKNKNGWWYVKNGIVDFSYTGFATNSNGKWYCENGKVTFKTNSVIKDTNGAIGTKGTWWYVVGSKVQTSYTGLANYSNSNGWWYIEKGKVKFTYNGIAQNKNGWWYIKGGKVIFSYTGYVTVASGTYYVKNGKVNR